MPLVACGVGAAMIRSLSKIVHALIFFAVAALTILGVSEASWDSVTVTLGNKRFEIPKRYYFESSLVEMFKGVVGVDDNSRDRLLLFEAKELAAEIPGYQIQDGKVTNDINVLLSILTDAERGRYLDSMHRNGDLWYGKGLYTGRVVEPYPGRPWFKVFHNFKGQRWDSVWELLKQYPNANQLIPEDISDYWIASCSVSKGTPTPSGQHISCTSRIIFDHIMIEFHVAEQNLSVIDQVQDYLKSKVMSWQRS